MTTTLTVIVLLLGSATRLPAAATELLRACIPFLHALHELRHAWRERGTAGRTAPTPAEDTTGTVDSAAPAARDAARRRPSA
ncbi:hypothetical protein [Streptomyces canus]|uniref:hypothetical protein n=1 Tax=Streptomyces canus TaxID=58343 RepID=UPI002DDB5C9B|nr:hypothetical protein [Streptomyces canus]WSD82882.1 hypothetical protein OG925_00245 [Streptomyces canus]WSD91952.1 hypothetical protein OG925_50235 [Streptomyces canus]WSD92559.1 hypothetical protein OG925_50725 [Streptomyces canus]